MTRWNEFAELKPQMAEYGQERFSQGVAYIATIRKDGSPRVHPVTPIISSERMFLFMDPTSPKGFDLRRDSRYAMHSTVADSECSNGEFRVMGRATLIEDPTLRTEAKAASSYTALDSYILFELSVEEAGTTVYGDEKPLSQHWKTLSEI